jgi:hypothetical protein
MSTFKLDLTSVPEHKVEYNGLEVVVKPLNKREDIKLVEKHTSGKVRVLQGQRKKGFRKKERDELQVPDVDYFQLNLERAVKSWKSWNIEGQECNESTITMLFENYYNELAEPLMEKLDEVIVDYNKGLEEEGKN